MFLTEGVEIRTRGASIAIVQSVIADYRQQFYETLYDVLAKRGIELTVFASASPEKAFLRDGLTALAFGQKIRSRHFVGNAYWQGGPKRFRDFDLVILPQEVRALSNYAILASKYLTGRPASVALWGHGANFQANGPTRETDLLRRFLNAGASHYFAYTELSRDAFVARGADPSRITVVNNSKSCFEIEKSRLEKSPEKRANVLRRIGFDPFAPVAVFCSRLHEGKQLPFLIDAACVAREKIPSLQLLIVGDGSMGDWLDNRIRDANWIKRVGALYGSEQADLLVSSDLFLMPAHVGLSILDAFAAGLPVVTASFANHSPEISYLENTVNGLVAPPDIHAYAASISEVLQNPDLRESMARAALLSAKEFSLDAMVGNFADGVDAVLDK